jgi:hypothetical protein
VHGGVARAGEASRLEACRNGTASSGFRHTVPLRVADNNGGGLDGPRLGGGLGVGRVAERCFAERVCCSDPHPCPSPIGWERGGLLLGA